MSNQNPFGVNTVAGQFQSGYDPTEGVQKVALIAWNPVTLAWQKLYTDANGNLVVSGAGGGGVGSAVTVTSGNITLLAGAATIGKVDQGAAGVAAWPVSIPANSTVVVTSGNIVVSGTVAVSGSVTTNGNAVVTQGTTPWVTNGNAVVSGTVGVSGTVTTNGNSVVSGTVSVSGTVTSNGNAVVTQGTTPWTTNGNSVVSGTVAVSSVAGNVAVTQVTTPWTTNGNAVVTGTVTVSSVSGGNMNVITTSACNITVFQGNAGSTAWPVSLTGNQNVNVMQVGSNAVVAQGKGQQATQFFPVLEAKDAGRTLLTFTVNRAVGVTTEALATMTINKANTVTTAAGYAVTAGKTLRLQSMSATLTNTSNVACNGRVIARYVASGNVLNTSSILCLLDIPTFTGTAIAGDGEFVQMSFPDGLEIPANSNLGVTQIASAATSNVSVCVVAYEY